MNRHDTVAAAGGPGSTGVPPVPAGVPPGGPTWRGSSRSVIATRRVDDSAGRRAGQAGRLCYPRLPAAAPSHTRRGSALMVVLWALVVLSAAVFAWARWIQQDLQINGRANRGSEALAMAHSGVAIALATAAVERTPVLEEELGQSLGYRARISSAGGKLNIGWLLQPMPQKPHPLRLAMLKTWLAMRGLSFREIDVLVDCLIDYTDADSLHELNGVEDEKDYHPANRPLQSIDEIMQVRGSKPLTKSPGWQDQLTLESTGPIDLLAAPAPILRLVPGMNEVRIQRLLAMRAGKDRVEGTKDDPTIQQMQQLLQSTLAPSPQEWQLMSQFILVPDPRVRIVAEGHSGKVVRQVEVVAEMTGGYPTILSWKE